MPVTATPVLPYKFTGDLRNLPVVNRATPGTFGAVELPKDRPLRTPLRGQNETDLSDANLAGKEPPQSTQNRAEMPKGKPLRTPLRGEKESDLSDADLTGIEPPQSTLNQVVEGFDTLHINVPGIPFQGVHPPDTVGDIGSNFYIQMTNADIGALFYVIDKNDGSAVAGPSKLSDLANPTGNCAAGLGDPIVLYDQYAGRWLMSEISASGNFLCISISATDDPLTGGWFSYVYNTPFLPDYPKYGVWQDAYYVGTNENFPTIYALDREAMLNGEPASPIIRAELPRLNGFGFQMVTPVDADGSFLPPEDSPGIFIRHNDDEVHNAANADPDHDYIEIFNFKVDFASGTGTQMLKQRIPVRDFDSDLCGLFNFFCFPQPGTQNTLDPLREVIMHRPQYRNWCTHESIVITWVTDVNGQDLGGVRWAEIRREHGESGDWYLYQEGTYSPDTTNRWMSSIAMDGSGNIAVGYSVSSANIFPGIRYVGRTKSDPLGQLTTGEQTIIDGSGSQIVTTRYGDYTAMSVDPIDDCTFWYTNEYIPANGNWETQIGAFSFPHCGSKSAKGKRKTGPSGKSGKIGDQLCKSKGTKGKGRNVKGKSTPPAHV